jgi:hypothetical protein
MYTSRIVLPTQLAVQAMPQEVACLVENEPEFPEYDIVEVPSGGWKITKYISFLKYMTIAHFMIYGNPSTNYKYWHLFHRLADQLDLLGPFDTIITNIRDLILENRMSLYPEHIRSAAEMPAGHEIRTLLAKACVKPYIHDSNKYRPVAGRLEFKMAKEVAELDGFAADLFREYGRAIRGKQIHTTRAKHNYLTIGDPLTGERFVV